MKIDQCPQGFPVAVVVVAQQPAMVSVSLISAFLTGEKKKGKPFRRSAVQNSENRKKKKIPIKDRLMSAGIPVAVVAQQP